MRAGVWSQGEEHVLADLDPACQESKMAGHCRAAFRRWFFNMVTMKRKRFTFGGCGATVVISGTMRMSAPM